MAQTENSLSKNQKLALVGLTVFGIFVLVLGAVSINNEIRKPFRLSSAENNNSSTAAISADEKSKTQDTDGDGLSDWDELNIYLTSPYLPDSDSDGIPDGTEIKNNTDPNCPQGKTCNAPASTATQNAANASADGGTRGAASPAISTASGSSADLSSLLLTGQIDTASLRQMLIQSGVNQADLDKISDADLLQAYQDQLASSSNR